MNAAAAVERIWPGRTARIDPLPGGITNRNHLVEVDGERFVLRLGGLDTELLGIDRSHEAAAGRAAFEAGVGPEVVAFLEPDGILVSRFIEGQALPPEQIRQPETLRRVADALLALHSALPIPGRFDSHQVVVQYHSVALQRGSVIHPAFDFALQVSDRIQAARGPQPTVPCHNDLLNANFLDDGRVRLVDWEYAGMGDRFFDLANLSVNHGFELSDDRALLQAYFGSARDADLAAVRVMRFMSDFREAMWGAVQSRISDIDFDFNGYADEHFQRLRAAAADPDFDGYVEACEPARMRLPEGS